MTITIKEFSSLEALGEKKWQELFSQCPSATVFQSWMWLSAWQETFTRGMPWVVSAWRNGELVAAAALFVDDKAVLRFIGEGHADFGQFLIKNDAAAYLNALIEHIFQRADKWEHAQFACVRQDSPLAAALEAKGAWQSATLPSPRVLFAARSGASLLSKSSLKRHSKKLSALGPVEVKHLDSSAAIVPYLEAFFRQHQERWAVTRTQSLFTDPANKAFYKALLEKAEPQGPICFTVILLKGKPVAMHLGFISEHQLIWYKPTYDPRLSAVGPGEVLIAELIKKALDAGLEGIDFTRGDEAFKMRFCSEVRHVVTFEAASHFWRKQIEVNRFKFRDALVAVIDRAHLHKPISRTVHNVKATVKALRTKGLKATCKEIKDYLEQHGPQHVDIFIKNKIDTGVCDARISVRALNTLDELFCEFDLNDPEHLEVLSDALVYLAAGARLWIALCKGEIVSSGWELRGSGVDITEVKARLRFPDSVVCLMEFRTFSKHQRKGYYASLLKSISVAQDAGHHLIYALSHNTASVKAIKNAGFEHAGRVTRSSLGALRFKRLKQGPDLSAVSLGGGAVKK